MDWKKLYEEEVAKLEELRVKHEKLLKNFNQWHTLTEKQQLDKEISEINREIQNCNINIPIYMSRAIAAGQMEELKSTKTELPKKQEEQPILVEDVFSALAVLMGGTQETDDAHDEKDDI